jgi:hypothetical protein
MAPGCVVGSDDDDPKTDGGTTGGSGGSGGSTGGSAGSGGRGGSAGTGGASGRGGAGGSGGGGATCSPASGDNACVACMKSNCCAELLACSADTDCSGMDGNGELTCIQDCALAVVADGGVVSDMVLASCAGQCATGSTVAESTNDAVACMHTGTRLDGGEGQDCHVQCLSGD